MLKSIVLSGHCRDQLVPRGVAEEEIVEAIRSAEWKPAESGRLECRKEFPFRNEWNGKRYDIKQVRPIFVESPDEIVVVTVYSYYFRHEEAR